MIRHIVLVRFRPETSETQISVMFDQLAAIQEKIPGFLSWVAGRSESPEQMERGYMHGFTIDFRDWEALAAYQAHADHKHLGAQLVEHADGGLDGILVFDLPTSDGDR